MVGVCETIRSEMNNGRDPKGKRRAGDPTVVARVQMRDPEELVPMLRQGLTELPVEAHQHRQRRRYFRFEKTQENRGSNTRTLPNTSESPAFKLKDGDTNG